jgi:hypothetical protein
MVESESLSALTGLGSKSQEMLARAGATSVARLRDVGAVEPYVLAERAIPGASLNLLWALEGPPVASRGTRWRGFTALAFCSRTSRSAPFANDRLRCRIPLADGRRNPLPRVRS